MSAVLNLGSLILGLISWVVPIMRIGLKTKKNITSHCSIISFSSCATSLLLQIFEIKNRVNLEDWTAIMDTIDTVALESVVLVAVTVILNIFALKKFSNT